MDKNIVTIKKTYDAPIAKVWEAISNKEQMKQWYFEVSDFKAEVGFEFQFYGESKEKKYLHNCTVVQADHLRTLAYTWSYEGYAGQSLVTFELFSEGNNKTHMKLTHADLGTFPKDNPDFAVENFNQGWKTIIEKLLRNFVEQE